MIVAYGLFGAVRRHRAGRQHGADRRAHVAARRDADPARHRRHRADHRHGGRRQRADLRAHPRGGAARAAPISAHRRRLPRASRTIIDSNITHADRRRSRCSSSAPARCRASPSRWRSASSLGVHRRHRHPPARRLWYPARRARRRCRSEDFAMRRIRLVPDDTTHPVHECAAAAIAFALVADRPLASSSFAHHRASTTASTSRAAR